MQEIADYWSVSLSADRTSVVVNCSSPKVRRSKGNRAITASSYTISRYYTYIIVAQYIVLHATT